MAISRTEELKINESSLIKEMLIYELQQVEKATGFITISSEKELVNYALINLLHDYKNEGSLEGTVISLSENLEIYLKEKFSIPYKNGTKSNVITSEDYSKVINNLNGRIKKLETEIILKDTNFVEDWIEEHIEIIEDKSEEEIRKNCLEQVKKELANLKVDIDSSNGVNLIPYNFMYMLSDVYNLTPEVIVNKVEKDLAELEAN